MEADTIEEDSLLVAKAMMYRRQKRCRGSRSKPSTPAVEMTLGPMANCKGPEFRDYVYMGRGLQRAPSTPSCSESDESGTIPECASLSPAEVSTNSELANQGVLEEIAEILERIGDEEESNLEPQIQSAFRRVRSEASGTITYQTWKDAILSLISGRELEFAAMAAVFRFSDRFLSQTEQDTGGVPSTVLEQRLEDYNKQILVDLFGAFLHRVNGFVSCLATRKEGGASSQSGAGSDKNGPSSGTSV